jgi:hypothetical protein
MQSFLLLRNFIFDKNYTTSSNGIEAKGTDFAHRGKRYSLCHFFCIYVIQNNHSLELGAAYEFL